MRCNFRLRKIEIPASVTSIGDYAFYWCDGLTSITFLSGTTELYDNADTIYSGATIYGYTGSAAEAYATKYGRTFKAIEP